MNTEHHCWKDYEDWVAEVHGENSIEHLDAQIARHERETTGKTCLLPKGHEGPHEWTRDDEWTVQFKQEGATP